eukprot:CAMPEP_0114587464 /NCGR_PEP_ID=MMETSP0125-20121206/10414_1 /TAXON_ID=485358 ORGANISM="Aristerostoma sp., Strain ATCC 50986" /NCGR_SAMPLE_ID=MMETSP0125 /ASSEMBLY_ACC=CAM_ASM_000245 /LENGTH=497 /DNA_ID=CAMNT_0001783381 /DNA_START=38 /DNA_END=1532 /DNA_ORIENTATION=+
MDSNTPYDLSIFVFRRDFRLVDNNGLNKASFSSKEVLPMFHFNPVQIQPEKNEYFNHSSVQVMCESLDELDQDLRAQNSRLYYFFADFEESFIEILDKIKPNAVYVNEDYTPFSTKRDELMEKLCKERDIAFHSCHDMMLNEKNKVLQKNGKFFHQYTPYFLKASKQKIPKPSTYKVNNFINGEKKFDFEFTGNIHEFYVSNPNIEMNGGRKIQVLAQFDEQKEYSKTRVFPALGTTKISAHAKYGTLSIREIYWKVVDTLGKGHELVRQLFWRDYYYNIVYHHPDTVYDAYIPQLKNVIWPHNEEWFEAWKQGKTGYPFIDAGMRHLLATNYFPNIMRMVVANYLVKVMLIDWRKGQLHLANYMLDYDLAQNNGGWQWAAATGSVCQPFDVVFDPSYQGIQYDSDCEYIKKWVPELQDVPKDHIHNWAEHYKKYSDIGYPGPICDFEERKKLAIEWYRDYVGGDAKETKVDIKGQVMNEAMFEQGEFNEGDLEDFI